MAKITMMAPRCEMKGDIHSDAYHQKLVAAYRNTYGRYSYRDGKLVLEASGVKCETCTFGNEARHATVWGEAICQDCYEAADHPCTQVYPGDLGFSGFG